MITVSGTVFNEVLPGTFVFNAGAVVLSIGLAVTVGVPALLFRVGEPGKEAAGVAGVLVLPKDGALVVGGVALEGVLLDKDGGLDRLGAPATPGSGKEPVPVAGALLLPAEVTGVVVLLTSRLTPPRVGAFCGRPGG